MKFILCCVVLLTFAFTRVVSQNSDTIKPGQCPAPSFTPEQCARIRFRFMCNKDSDCEGDQKCCNNGCVGQCMTPIQTKTKRSSSRTYLPGKCPAPSITPELCARIRFRFMCNIDGDCEAGQKCCNNGCVGQCMPQIQASASRTTVAPITARKPGRCPAPRYKASDCIATTFPFVCNVDADCEGIKKCCSNGCAGVCIVPTQTQMTSASCPLPTLTREQCKFVKFASCENNTGCNGNRICCNNGCGKTCMEPVVKTSTPTCTAKAGSCSKQNINCIWSQCKSDCDCPGNQKCCHGCLCTAPVPTS